MGCNCRGIVINTYSKARVGKREVPSMMIYCVFWLHLTRVMVHFVPYASNLYRDVLK
jgi:hypothetical protein